MVDYGTVAGFKTYHSARGRADIIENFDDSEIDAAKLITSEWLDATYRNQFPGLKVGMREQVREWPRQGASDIHGYAISSATVPTEVENATYEGTFRQLQTPGIFSKDYTPNKYKSVSVDGAVSIQYVQFGGAGDIQTQIKIIDEILAPILTAYGDFSPLSGGTALV